MPTEPKVFWHGHDVEKLSRESLLLVIREAVDLIQIKDRTISAISEARRIKIPNEVGPMIGKYPIKPGAGV